MNPANPGFHSDFLFPIKTEMTTLVASKNKKLDALWKFWSCPDCGDSLLYTGKLPQQCKKHKCKKKLEAVFVGDMAELIDAMGEEISKEISKEYIGDVLEIF